MVPCQLQENIMEESHHGPMGGHFSGVIGYLASSVFFTRALSKIHEVISNKVAGVA